MDDGDDLGHALIGFRRAEVALASIAEDADRLADARVEVEQARDELKVVAGALVGLATAHRELVGQLGDAAAALGPAERRDEDLLIEALRDAEATRARQVAEVADAVEELARRLDRALTERIGGVVAELAARLPSAEHVAAVAERLGELATADRLAALAERLDALASAAQLSALADRLDQLDGLARASQVEELARGVSGLARADQIDALADRLDRAEQAGRPPDLQWLVGRLDVLDRRPGPEQLAAIQDALAALPTRTDLARLDDTVTTSDLEAVASRLSRSLDEAAAALPPPAPAEEVAEMAAVQATRVVEEQVARLVEEVHASQRRVQQLVLAVGVSFLIFAALVSVLALR